MPAGLQVWDGVGRLILDLTDRMGKVVQAGPISYPGGGVWTTVGVPGFQDDGNWCVIFFGQYYTQPIVEYFAGGFRVTNPPSQTTARSFSYAVLRL